MPTMTVTDARKNLFGLIDDVADEHCACCIVGLRPNAERLLAVLAANPFKVPPPYEALVGNLKGAFSRRINIQHRLVYQVLADERIVKVLRMWTHYE